MIPHKLTPLKSTPLTQEDTAIFRRFSPRFNFRRLRHRYYHADTKAFTQMREKIVSRLGGTRYADWLVAKYKRWHGKPRNLKSSKHM